MDQRRKARVPGCWYPQARAALCRKPVGSEEHFLERNSEEETVSLGETKEEMGLRV